MAPYRKFNIQYCKNFFNQLPEIILKITQRNLDTKVMRNETNSEKIERKGNNRLSRV